MGWTKIAVFALLFVVISVVGLFGSHFGYTVHGVPQVTQFSTVNPPQGQDWQAYHLVGSDEIIMWRNTVTGEEIPNSEGGSAIGDAITYLWNMATFSIDGMESWMSFLFVLIVLLALFILVTIFLPGGGG